MRLFASGVKLGRLIDHAFRVMREPIGASGRALSFDVHAWSLMHEAICVSGEAEVPQ